MELFFQSPILCSTQSRGSSGILMDLFFLQILANPLNLDKASKFEILQILTNLSNFDKFVKFVELKK